MKADEKYDPDIERGKETIKQILDDDGNIKLRTNEAHLKNILKGLNKHFRNIGTLNSSIDDIPQRGDFPTSDKINRLVENLARDVFEIFAEQEALEYEITQSENISQTQRNTLRILKGIAENKLYNGTSRTITDDAAKYWFTDSFTEDTNIDTENTDENMHDHDEGAITLGYTDEVIITNEDFVWRVNNTKTSINNESYGSIPDVEQKTKIYNGHRYGLFNEVKKDDPVVSLQTVESTNNFENDTEFSEFEIIVAETPKLRTLKHYIRQQIQARLRAGYNVVPTGSNIIINMSLDEFGGFDSVDQLKFAATLNAVMPDNTPVSKVYISRNSKPEGSAGTVLLKSIAAYTSDGIRINENSGVKDETSDMNSKTFNGEPAKTIAIGLQANNNGTADNFPYYVAVIPSVVQMQSTTADVKINWSKLKVRDLTEEEIDGIYNGGV